MPADFFLKIDGIQGESKDAKHKGEIELESWSWSETQTGAVAGGQGTGKVNMSSLTVSSLFSSASPQLIVACASGKHLKSAVLTCRRAGDKDAFEFLTFSLTDVLVSSVQEGAGGGGDSPTESFSLDFGRIQIEYRQQNDDGSPGAVSKGGWDVKKNAPA